MYIYNSLTNKKEEFVPLEPNKVKMYVCGPTVYNHIHIGNARPIIFFDVVRRFLEYLGYQVVHVSNITDVDDRIIEQAGREHVSETEIARKYTEAYVTELKRLGVKPYHHMPKVTDHMNHIIQFIEELIAKGFAYEVEGDVYFRISKLKDYGKLSNQALEHLEVGARITDHDKKENPLDFTLWKKTDKGIQWDSPWGQGRPGWHTECVTMIHHHLGPIIDIHGGGSDLKFPHHENEIAQSEAVAHTPLAKYWMHNGRLMIDEEKMSKSLGNVILLKDFLNQYDGNVLRYFMLSTHYRQPLNYTDEAIRQAQKEIEKVTSAYQFLTHKLDFFDPDGNETETPELKALKDEFIAALSDDFNTPNAISTLQTLLKTINRKIRRSQLTKAELMELRGMRRLLQTFLEVLGFSIAVTHLTEEDKTLIRLKEEARKNKNYELADQYRAQLQKKGIYL